MDAQSRYLNDGLTLERGNLRSRNRSYSHKLNVQGLDSPIIGVYTMPLAVHVLLRRFKAVHSRQ